MKAFFAPKERPLRIGNNVSIAGEVRIYTMEHDVDDPNFAETGAPVVIEDYVVIAPGNDIARRHNRQRGRGSKWRGCHERCGAFYGGRGVPHNLSKIVSTTFTIHSNLPGCFNNTHENSA